jgi:site-specific DNA recombinase
MVLTRLSDKPSRFASGQPVILRRCESVGIKKAATVDLPLLKAIARAHRWFDEISIGKASSLAEIAAREGLTVRYVGRLIGLAFLAPDIVESIVQGRQPTSLTAEALTRRIELPLEWRSQKAALNIQ